MSKVKAWIATIAGLAAALFVFCNFSIEGYLWNKEEDNAVSAQELKENTSDTYIGHPAAEDVPKITSLEDFEQMADSIDTATVLPKSIIPTGVYSLGKWSDYFTSRKNGTSWRRKEEVLTSSFLAGLWGDYSEYYLIELEDGEYILAQMNDCIAGEIKKGESLLLPVGHKIGFSQKAKKEMSDICNEYGASMKYVFYAIDDNWQSEHSFALFIGRAIAAFLCFVVVVVVILLFSWLLGRRFHDSKHRKPDGHSGVLQ